jgi:hypothetical protein
VEQVVDNVTVAEDSSDSHETADSARSSASTRNRSSPYGHRRPKSACIPAVRRALTSKGFSAEAVDRIVRERRTSTLKVYDAKWIVFERWCQRRKLDPLTLCTADLADFFLFLFNQKKLAPITIKGYRSAIARVYRLCGLDNPGRDTYLSNLVNNFCIERPRRTQLFPKWSLDIVLTFISQSPFEPLEAASLENVTLKTAFLLTLALAGHMSEIHALSAREDCMRFNQDGSVSLLTFPGFLAKKCFTRAWQPIVCA